MERADLFTVIHKAIRRMLFELGAIIQSADFTDTAVIEDVARRVDATITMMDEHAEHEDLRIFPVVREHEEQIASELDGEHRALEAKQEAVREAVAALRAAGDKDTRIAAGNALHTRFNEMAAYCLTHMSHEEATALPATWTHLNDAQIIEIRTNIQMNTPPVRYGDWLKWMLPAMNINEMAQMLAGMKASVPAPVFEILAGMGKNALGEDHWRRVLERAGLA